MNQPLQAFQLSQAQNQTQPQSLSNSSLASPSPDLSQTQVMISAMVGALSSAVFVQPLDVIKTRLQIDSANQLSRRLRFGMQKNNSWIRIPHSLQVGREIVSSEGVFGLWRGLSPTLFMSVPSVAIYLTMYESLRDYFTSTFAG